MKKDKIKKISMEIVMDDPQYRGYHVVVVAGKVFKAKTGEKASKILEEIHKRYPKEIPEITYIPDADTLIFGTPSLMKRHLFLETFETLSSTDHTVAFTGR